MTTGQTIGQLIGHLCVVAGALICIWALGRFFVVGNGPAEAVQTVLLFVYGAAFQGWGKILVWFSGGTNA